MPSISELSVDLMNHTDLVDYTIDNGGVVYDQIAQQVNSELRATPSLTVDEAWEQACARILENNGFSIERNGSGRWTASAFSDMKQVTDVINPLDSNSSVIKRGMFRNMYGNIKQFDGTNQYMQVSRFPVSGGLGSQAGYVIGSVSGAIAAVSSGISMGKTFDSALYNLMPDFWDSIGMSTLNPETWNSITNGDDSPFARLFNVILGLNPDTGESQMYMNEEAYAYMAYMLSQNGFFDATYQQTTISDYTNLIDTAHTTPPYPFVKNQAIGAIFSEYQVTTMIDVLNANDDYYILLSSTTDGTIWTLYIAKGNYSTLRVRLGNRYGDVDNVRTSTLTFEGDDYSYYCDYTRPRYVADLYSIPFAQTTYSWGDTSRSSNIVYNFLYCMKYGTTGESGGIEGVGTQPDASLPDISDWDSIPNTLESLKNQYPDLFANPMVWNDDNPYSETGGNTSNWIPVPMPDFRNMTDTQPTSGTQTQSSLKVNQLPDSLLQTIMNMLQSTKTETDPQMVTPPQNPVTTGTGEPPALVPPSGSASALWSVYHPTQAQVNSFGAWLWTDNIITQIQQLLQNPMEGIITLHKVFAPPVDSGQGTIVVGRLNSNVPSATVNQQYVTVDCGEIDCFEQFGNVFDYSPFTSVSIYLPFIGIAPLSVNDIMRSKIHVTYGVDVFTGVCLAMIEVSRDGNSINMYQYAGVASVEYPLTGTVHNGLITGIMGIVGGFATIATAGAAAPVAIGGVAAAGAGALATGRQSQSRSGNFSGNAGAMGIKTPYLIIERPQTKVADTFPQLAGYPTNKSVTLNECSGHIVVKHVHVEGINATQGELMEIENLLQSGVLV